MWSHLRAGNEKYPALTGVRALGASVIFFDHFPLLADRHIILNVMAFFYGLSGFLIFRIYYAQAQLSRRWLSRYFVNRFGRIYPVYFLLLTLAVWLLPTSVRPQALITNYTLTHALFNPSRLIIEPSWSLTVEECFYALAPLFMILTRRRGIFATLGLGVVLCGAALLISQWPIAFLHGARFVMTTTFFGHFLEFFAGAGLACVVMRLEGDGEIAPRHGARYTLLGLFAVAVLVASMVVIYDRPPLNLGAIIAINNFLIPLPIAWLYFGLIRERTVLARLLSAPFMGLLGRASYSFYLLHMLVIDYVSLPLLPTIRSRFACVLLTFVATWLLAVLLYALYEEPLNLSIRRIFGSGEKWVGERATLFR
jgi:peptidoglycan/LPS O-acetylase OafA/YrhL